MIPNRSVRSSSALSEGRNLDAIESLVQSGHRERRAMGSPEIRWRAAASTRSGARTKWVAGRTTTCIRRRSTGRFRTTTVAVKFSYEITPKAGPMKGEKIGWQVASHGQERQDRREEFFYSM